MHTDENIHFLNMCVPVRMAMYLCESYCLFCTGTIGIKHIYGENIVFCYAKWYRPVSAWNI